MVGCGRDFCEYRFIYAKFPKLLVWKKIPIDWRWFISGTGDEDQNFSQLSQKPRRSTCLQPVVSDSEAESDGEEEIIGSDDDGDEDEVVVAESDEDEVVMAQSDDDEMEVGKSDEDDLVVVESDEEELAKMDRTEIESVHSDFQDI